MHENDSQVNARTARLRERYGELLQELIVFPHGGMTAVLTTGDREAYSADGELLREPRERSMLRWVRLLRRRRAGNR